MVQRRFSHNDVKKRILLRCFLIPRIYELPSYYIIMEAPKVANGQAVRGVLTDVKNLGASVAGFGTKHTDLAIRIAIFTAGSYSIMIENTGLLKYYCNLIPVL